jgi:hypothetical protein
MRGENGLLADTVWVEERPNGRLQLNVLNPDTSPTNIAVDLMVQTELLSKTDSPRSLQKISTVLDVLEKVDYHHPTGLFFSRYTTHHLSLAKDLSVSSIDNLHLAIALWTIHETFPKTSISHRARLLFERMNLSAFYDKKTHLIGGNLKPVDGRWEHESYRFSYFGSEARALYSAGWALGLFRDLKLSDRFPKSALDAIKIETFKSQQGHLLKLWDGSAFQLFFPKLFVGEELYSASMSAMFSSAGRFMIAEAGHRRIPVPAAHSASRMRISDTDGPDLESAYRDKSGNIAMVSSSNDDIQNRRLRRSWNATMTPNALMMAATSNPNKFIPLFAQMESMRSSEGHFYLAGFGFMDGIHVKGQSKGEVVPAQLSLNQGVSALSLLEMLSPDGLTPGARAMFANTEVRRRLQNFYDTFEAKLKASTGQNEAK